MKKIRLIIKKWFYNGQWEDREKYLLIDTASSFSVDGPGYRKSGFKQSYHFPTLKKLNDFLANDVAKSKRDNFIVYKKLTNKESKQ